MPRVKRGDWITLTSDWLVCNVCRPYLEFALFSVESFLGEHFERGVDAHPGAVLQSRLQQPWHRWLGTRLLRVHVEVQDVCAYHHETSRIPPWMSKRTICIPDVGGWRCRCDLRLRPCDRVTRTDLAKMPKPTQLKLYATPLPPNFQLLRHTKVIPVVTYIIVQKLNSLNCLVTSTVGLSIHHTTKQQISTRKARQSLYVATRVFDHSPNSNRPRTLSDRATAERL